MSLPYFPGELLTMRCSRSTLSMFAIFCGVEACGQSTAPTENAAGTYVLESLDGVVTPAFRDSYANCPGPISHGELHLGDGNSEVPPMYSFLIAIAGACGGDGPIDGSFAHKDAGFWSTDGEKARFRSLDLYGFGSYEGQISFGTLNETRATLQFDIGDHNFIWRRITTDETNLSPFAVSVVDQQGHLVNGVQLEFRRSDGVVANGVTNNDRAFLSGAPNGVTVTIHADLPLGYTFAPSQPVPVAIVSGQTGEVTVRVVKA